MKYIAVREIHEVVGGGPDEDDPQGKVFHLHYHGFIVVKGDGPFMSPQFEEVVGFHVNKDDAHAMKVIHQNHPELSEDLK